MQDRDGVFPDDVPVADAAEQRQPTERDSEPEEELTASDWLEQRETVVIDPEIDAPEQRE
jgi:hypothetical protein